MTLSENPTLFVPGADDGLAATLALVSSGRYDNYVAYARDGRRWFAGNAVAEVICEPDRVHWRIDGQERSAALGSRPLRQLGDIIATMPPLGGRRVFGYLTFELALLSHGVPLPGSAGPRLAHFIVPEVEVEWDAAGSTIRAVDGASHEVAAEIMRRPRSPLGGSPRSVELTSAGSQSSYQDIVVDAVRAIRQGLLHKVILSRRVDVPYPVHLPLSYVAGMRYNTPARSFLLGLDGTRCAGFSPETIVEVDATGRVVTQPLAGTRPLVGSADVDRRLREELAWDVKECFEHVISARLATEELGRVCAADSVAVTELMSVRARGTVQHLASKITGRLRAGLDMWDALEAVYPAVTASGIPKAPAVRMIREVEGERGLYSGAVCMLDKSTMDVALVLRSIFQDRHGRSWLQAGAGIVTDSDPGREYEETTNKLRSAAGCLVDDDRMDTARSVNPRSAATREVRT